MTLRFVASGTSTPTPPTPSSSTVATMAPAPPSPASVPAPSFDYGPLIRANCRVFLGPNADIDVSTQLDSDGQWDANATTLRDGHRTKVLGASADTFLRAMELLHEKSARAANNYIKANGFAVPRKVASRSSRLSRPEARRPDPAHATTSDELEVSEVLAVCESSSDEYSDSDDGSLQVLNGRLGSGRPRRIHGVSMKGMAMRMPLNASADVPDHGFLADKSLPHRGMQSPPHRLPVPGRASMPPPPAPVQAPLPASVPVPPGPAPALGPVPFPARDGRFSMRPGWYGAPPNHHHPMPPPPPRNLVKQETTPPTAAAAAAAVPKEAIPVCLTVRWVGHGERKMLVSCVPTEKDLTQRALGVVRSRTSTFANVTAADFTPASMCSLRAVVRQVTLGGDRCEVAGFGDDYSALCRGSAGVVGFDIEVSHWTPSPPPPLTQPMAARPDVESDDEDRD